MSHSVQLVVPAHAPWFEGHFPGDPIVPAVAILEFVIDTIVRSLGEAHRPRTLQSAKFLAPVRPGDTLAIEVDPRAASLRFSCRIGSRVVAVGAFAVREA